jgi:leucyl aminopeptidase
MLDVNFAAPSLPKDGALALLVAEGASPSGLWQEADAATGGAIARAFQASEFTGKEGQICTILAPGAGLSRIVAAGLGKPAELTDRRVEEAGGALAAAVARNDHAHLAADGLTPSQAASAALGAVLRHYHFDLYRTKQKPEDKPKLNTLTVLAGDAQAASAAWTPLRAIAHGSFITRDLVSEPANILTPAEFARRIEKLSELGLEIEVLRLADGCGARQR